MHIDGVVDCRVNLKDNSATIAVRDAAVEPQVKSGIEKLGYTVSMVPNSTSTAAPIPSSATSNAPAQPK
jgi:hypothetical protein